MKKTRKEMEKAVIHKEEKTWETEQSMEKQRA